jgi:hypothetical protein
MIDAASKHGDGAALECGQMRSGIDAAGKALGNGKAFETEIGRKATCELLSDRGVITRAHARDDRARGKIEIALHIKKRRCCVDLGKSRRVTGLADRDEISSEDFSRIKLFFRLTLAVEADVLSAAASARQHRQGVGRRFGTAEIIDEGAKGGGPDILAADQPKTRQPAGSGST